MTAPAPAPAAPPVAARRARAPRRFADALDGVPGTDRHGLAAELGIVDALRALRPRLDPTPTARAAARERLVAALIADRGTAADGPGSPVRSSATPPAGRPMLLTG